MRKFKQYLNKLIEASPKGMDFLCSMEFDKHAKQLFYIYKGHAIYCSHKVPKSKIFFINYELDYERKAESTPEV